jgi:hypothetical protein
VNLKGHLMTKAPNKPADEGAKTVTSETTLPATGTAGATASAAGAVTLAADAGDASEMTTSDGGQIDPEGRYTLVVQGPAAGRWRIGRKFTAEPTSIPASELTEAQVTALRDDPALMVSVIAAPY